MTSNLPSAAILLLLSGAPVLSASPPAPGERPNLVFQKGASGGPALEIGTPRSALRLGGGSGPLVFLRESGTQGEVRPADPGTFRLEEKKEDGSLSLSGRFAPQGPAFRLRLIPAGPEEVELRLSAPPGDPARELGISIALEGEEALYGLLERTLPGNQALSWRPGIRRGLDLRGLEVEMVVRPTLGIYEPFLVSTRGWSLLVQGTWPGRFDLGARRAGTLSLSFQGPELRVRFRLAGSPLACVRAFTLRAGPPFRPPSWVFGPWRWRDEHKNPPRFFDGTPNRLPFNSQVVEDVLMMEALGIPCTAYWVDRPWARGFMGYASLQFDRARLPRPRGMIRWLRRKGMAFLLWLAPWVAGAPLRAARERGYLLEPCRAGKGEKERVLLDFTHPSAVAWWQDRLAPLVEAGVAGFKLDRSEELFRSLGEVRAADGRTLTEVRNDYPRLYLAAVHDLLERLVPGKGAAMPRAGYTGSQALGIFWGGDIRGGPWGLRAALVALQRAAFMGFPFWGSDTGGYWGVLDREAVRRWLAFSCFCPVMEVGPTWNRAPWCWPKGEPSYDVETLATWRFYARLRMRMKPYLEREARRTCQVGEPLVRPLAMLWPDRKEARERWDEYLFGPDLLVCPVWKKGVRVRPVWLPPGEWVDAWTGEDRRGPAWISLPCPPPRIPLFLRKGASLSLGDLPALWTESVQAVALPPSMAALQEKALEELEEEGKK